MNPLIKSIVSNAAGSAVLGVGYAIAHPTGGFATCLTTHPLLGMLYGFVTLTVHNAISNADFVRTK